MTPDFFSRLDGSGRAPRDAQRKALEQLSEQWDKWDCHALILPTGAGKTLIARTIQLATDAAYLSSTNVLVNQYMGAYKGMNRFVGEAHYHSAASYDNAKMLALDPENHTAYNPCSFRIAAKHKEFRHPDVIIFDEADQALSLLHELSSTVLALSSYDYRKRNLTVPADAAQYVLQCAAEKRVQAYENEKNGKRMQARRYEAAAVRLEDLAESLIAEPERFALQITEKMLKFGPKRYLHIHPTFLPKTAAKTFFKHSKIILLSATLMPSDVQELTGGTPFCRIETPSPIPVERRRIYLKPCDEALSYPINYDMLAAKLDEVLDEVPVRPCLIHATYRDSLELSKRMKHPVLTHDKQDKQEVIDEWLRNGGIMIGSGCTTGLDLRQDMCRLNIISKLVFPSMESDLVKKRLALPGGRNSYNLSAFRELVQAAGRSTRSETDYSVTVVLDGRLAKLYNNVKEDVPAFIREGMVWQDVSYQTIREQIRLYIGDTGSAQNAQKVTK